MNQLIIECFQRLIDYHRSQGTNEFKLRSFIKALSIFKKLDVEITNSEQLKGIPGMGKGTLTRVDEILETGNLSEIKDENQDLKNLIRITGIGPAKAAKLLTNGITLEKLQDNQQIANENLTHHQLIGLKYLEDIESRIPYKEISAMERLLKRELYDIDPNLSFKICGSYRRKKRDSGDMDVLLYYDSPALEDPYILKSVVSNLTESGFLIEHLTELGQTKYMGLCRLLKEKGGPARRIDIRFIHHSNIPFAIMYFTGSGEFNKNMRTYVNKLGYKLNEYNIENVHNPTDPPIYLKSEREIFKFFNMPYIKPEDRIPDYNFGIFTPET
jgi:DNA polymerase/3'-5' exonuclease PolX